MQIAELRTPAMLIDTDRLAQNCAFMAHRAHTLGVRLRPHVKTHKVPEIGRLQVADHFGGITVSTMAEAKAFSAAGFSDITLAVPLDPRKASEAVALAVNVLVDSEEALAAVERVAGGYPRPRVWLKVDCGYGRAGVNPQTESAVRLASRIHESPSVDFAGLLTHGGHSYARIGSAAILDVAREERDAVVKFARRLRDHAIEVDEVSVGSTPTMMHVDHLEGVTEIRPGNYALFDGFQAQIGSCPRDWIAATVLVSVISVHADRAIVDAGALALSKDSGLGDSGYGVVIDSSGMALANLSLVSLSQEHGKLMGDGVSQLRVGDRLRIIPNHSCLAVACFETIYGVRKGVVEHEWTPCRGW